MLPIVAVSVFLMQFMGKSHQPGKVVVVLADPDGAWMIDMGALIWNILYIECIL